MSLHAKRLVEQRSCAARAFALTVLLAIILAVTGCSQNVVFEGDDPWNDPTDWPGIGSGKLLVTNSGDDTVSFLDPETMEPVYVAPTGRIPTEREGPHHAAVMPDGSHYFVGISNFVPGSGSGPHGSHGNGTVDGYLLRYETITNTRVDEVRVDRSPGDVRITPNGRYVLQSHFDLQSILDAVMEGDDPRDVRSRLAVVDAATMEKVAMIPVCPAAHGIAIAADSSEVYMACWGSDELAVVSLAEPITPENSVERYAVGPAGGDPTSPRYGPYAISVSPANGEVWVSNLEGSSLVVFDPTTREFDPAREATLIGSPLFSMFSTDGTTLFVPQQNPDALLQVDPTTGTFETYNFTDECDAPHGVLTMPAPTILGMVCEGDRLTPGSVVRMSLDGQTEVVNEYEVGVYPDDLVLMPGDS